MAERRRHIDRAIRTKLKDYREAAPPEVWEAVAGHLAITRRKGRVFWITRIAAAAVVVIMAGSAWLLMRDTPQVVTEQGQPEEQQAGGQESAEQLAESLTEDRDAIAEETLSGVSEPGTEDSYARVQPMLIASDLQSGEPLTGQETDAAIRPEGGGIISLEAMYIAALDPGLSPDRAPDLLRENRAPQRDYQHDRPEGIVLIDGSSGTEEAAGSRWALGTQISPVYSYRDLGGGSSFLSNAFSRADAVPAASSNSAYNAVESGMMAYSGGVNLNYLTGDRLSVQSGLYYSRMGLAVDHAYLSPYNQSSRSLAETLKYQTISNSSGTIVAGDSPASPGSGAVIISNLSPTGETTDYANQAVYEQLNIQINSGQVEQQFEYLEVPMIVKYKMVDRRIGLNVLGGMTTNFLVGSDAYYIENSNRELIGRTIDLKKVNYSSLVGLGMDYKLSKRFQLNLEPFFKYYLNSINLASSIKSRPYSIGVYTGISYLF